ncbi:MAG: hypothetical protein ACI9C2_000359 [Gammaproteobacteria bacterium]|jgi:hypothetical protein
MTVQDYKQLVSSALLLSEEVTSAEALALASMPGACEADRYRIFVEMEETFTKGSFARIEFVLPGKPGRWCAAGEVIYEVKLPAVGVPKGVCLELFGLNLTAPESPVADEGAPEMQEGEQGPALESAGAFDPTNLSLDSEDVCSMLRDLMGRELEVGGECVLPAGLKDNAVIAIFRNDAGESIFTITFDKGGATRVGGALTMLPEDLMNGKAKSKDPLEGEPLENVSEVLNIMSALFHEAGSPHLVLAEVIQGAEMREYNGGEFVALFDEPRWSIAHGFTVEDYGVGQVYIAAR